MVEYAQTLNYVSAIGTAIMEEMRRDERVVAWGQDLVSMRGTFGDAPGMIDEFGGDRIIDTPIIEQAIAQMAVGAALAGSRPIAYIATAGFLSVCFDTLFMKMGAMRQEFSYKGPMPLVIFCRAGVGGGFGADHCTSTEALFMHTPGLKIVMPSTPYDAKGLMKAAIRDDDPVLFIASGPLYFGTKQFVPVEDYIIPLGQADIKREGTDITIVAWSGMIPKALNAAEILSKDNINAEVVDLRTIVPMDIEAVVKSAKKTGRLLIAHDAMKRGGAAAEIAMKINEVAPDVVANLKTPIRRLAAKNLGLPRNRELEAELVPQIPDVIQIVKEMV
ncbi:MAG: transketolase C-terminal domain-containing protein [Dehalococcoidales bacterium]|nr:transketolase C-terminal domain-containing protein [Dehalococcoidales bacterium]